MGRSRYVVLVLAVAAFAAVAAGAATAAADSPGSAAAETESADFADIDEDGFEADRTRFLITTYGNGSADWTFRYEQRLETDDDIENFGGFAARFTETETDAYTEFQARADSLAASGEEATDRRMAASRFDRDAYIEERPPAGTEFGIVEMTFRWNGFAAIEDDNVTVGDVFVGGLYVDPDNELQFEAGPGLAFESVDPEPDSMAGGTLAESETVTWVGEQEFTDRRPRLVHTEQQADRPPAEQNGDETPAPANNGSWLVPLAALLVVVLAGGTAIAYQTGTFPRRTESGGDGTAENDAGGVSTTETVDDGTAASGAAGGDETPDRDAEGRTDTVATGEPAVTDEMLQPDEKRVVDLLERNGGRMKQVAIVDETDWSKSKVSMLLSEMEEEGTVSKLRVGRENIVSLAGHEPAAAGSPFDDGEDDTDGT